MKQELPRGVVLTLRSISDEIVWDNWTDASTDDEPGDLPEYYAVCEVLHAKLEYLREALCDHPDADEHSDTIEQVQTLLAAIAKYEA